MHIYWLHISLEASVIGLTHAAYILSVVRTFYVDVWKFYLRVRGQMDK